MAEEEAGNEGGMRENVVQEELAVDDKEEVINRKNRSVERNKQRKNVIESDKVSNRKKPSVETDDLFRLPDFDDNNDEENKDYQPPPRVQGRKKAVIEDDEDEGNDDNSNNGGDDGDNDEDEDYEEEEDDGNDEEEDDDDDNEITLQTSVARKPKTRVVEEMEDDDLPMEQRTKGYRCSNVKEVTEFWKYIKGLMKNFQGHIRKGKQVKKYLMELINDMHEACQNMNYPGMTFDAEEIITAFLDPSFKAWQVYMKGVRYADRNDLKEANTRRNVNLITSDQSNKDATEAAKRALDNLERAQ